MQDREESPALCSPADSPVAALTIAGFVIDNLTRDEAAFVTNLKEF